MATTKPDVSFTNNLGSITFKRCLIAVTDSWQYSGRGSRHVKSISIDGHVKREEAGEKFHEILTRPWELNKHRGETGSLTLPWTTLQDIQIVDLSVGAGVWGEYIPFTATFADDRPENNRYTISFFGLTLFNPRISLPVAVRPVVDDMPRMPWMYSWNPMHPRTGVMRRRGGARNMEVSITGTIRASNGNLPDGLFSTLIRRAGIDFIPTGFNVPAGWPAPFNLGDAIPEIKDDTNLAHCIVVGGQVQWAVERNVAQVALNIMCPPQVPDRTSDED